MMKVIAVVGLMLVFFSSCSKKAVIATDDLKGTWLCYADFHPSDSLNNPLVLNFKANGEYDVTVFTNNFEQRKVSSGDFSIDRNHLHFDLMKHYDSVFVYPEHVFNNQPIKISEHSSQKGLQIKVNEMWYYFEKMN